MDKVKTVNEFIQKAVEKFVQTVVFVDDKIYAPLSVEMVKENKNTATPKKRKMAIKSAVNTNNNSNQKIINDEKTFSPHDIQASFAKKSIVCSLHQPGKTNSVSISSDTYKLCAAADIVIIDWDLYGDAGVKATILVKNLMVQSLKETPHQLRLILIYTSEPDLFSISDKIYDSLSKDISDELNFPCSDEGLAFHSKNARVVVLGKPGNRLQKYCCFECEEHKLAERAISEFCNLANGLLQGCMLFGLSELRKQGKRILTRFHSGLDAAFLTHRALGLPHEEAFDHIPVLLINEIKSILEDYYPDPLISDKIIGDWCNNKWEPANHSKDFIPQNIDMRDFAEEFCKKGMNIQDKYGTGKSNFGRTIKSLKKERWPSIDSDAFKMLVSFLNKDAKGNDLRELSILMSQRTYYHQNRYITLGTIIRECANEKRFLLCLQPTCDSIRLKHESTFIFCILEESEDDRTSFIVSDGAGSYIDLNYKPKIKNSITISFSPKCGSIVAEELEFIDSNNQRYRWYAQLEPKHAQRAAEQFARELSRVGLTESEWLRLKAKTNE